MCGFSHSSLSRRASGLHCILLPDVIPEGLFQYRWSGPGRSWVLSAGSRGSSADLWLGPGPVRAVHGARGCRRARDSGESGGSPGKGGLVIELASASSPGGSPSRPVHQTPLPETYFTCAFCVSKSCHFQTSVDVERGGRCTRCLSTTGHSTGVPLSPPHPFSHFHCLVFNCGTNCT